MDYHWQGLLANAAIAIFVLQVWISSREVAQRLGRVKGGIAFGVLFGIGAVLLMRFSIPIAPGVFVDFRMTLVGLCALAGGPLPGLVAGAIAMAYRVVQGGGGMMAGLACISLSVAAGLGQRYLRRRKPLNFPSVANFAAVLALAVLASVALVPGESMARSVPHLMFSLPLAVFICTLLAGLMMAQEMRWRRVQRENDIYRRAIDTLPDCLNVKDLAGRFLVANPATAALMGAPDVASLIARTDFDFYPARLASAFRLEEAAIMSRGEASAFEQEFHHADGRGGWLATLKAPLRDASGTLIGMITHNRDITGQKQTEEKLAETRRHFAEALANMADGLVMFGRDGRMVFSNEQYLSMFPKTAALRQPGHSYEAILRASIARGEQRAVEAGNEDEWIARFLSMLRVPGSNQFVVDDGRWIEARSRPGPDGSALIVYADITRMKQREQELNALNAELARLASTDGLTGVLNRRAFDASLLREVETAAANGERVSLMLSDIDHFKAFNDTYGHPAGDLVIKGVAECLSATFEGRNAVVGRYGGEEFAVLLRGGGADDMLQAAHDFRRRVCSLDIPHIGSRAGYVTVSAGFAASGDVRDPRIAATLLHRADKALYAAKAAGRNAVRGEPLLPAAIA